MLSPPGACLDIAVTSCVWQESSVEKFGAVHKKLKDVGKDETARGASLRELQRFFEEHDKNKGYAGLRRIPDEDGTVVWTILEDTKVAAQLKKRAGERHREEILSAAHAPKNEDLKDVQEVNLQKGPGAASSGGCCRLC